MYCTEIEARILNYVAHSIKVLSWMRRNLLFIFPSLSSLSSFLVEVAMWGYVGPNFCSFRSSLCCWRANELIFPASASDVAPFLRLGFLRGGCVFGRSIDQFCGFFIMRSDFISLSNVAVFDRLFLISLPLYLLSHSVCIVMCPSPCFFEKLQYFLNLPTSFRSFRLSTLTWFFPYHISIFRLHFLLFTFYPLILVW